MCWRTSAIAVLRKLPSRKPIDGSSTAGNYNTTCSCNSQEHRSNVETEPKAEKSYCAARDNQRCGGLTITLGTYLFRYRNIMPAARHKERHVFAAPPKASDGLVWLLGRAYLNFTVFLQEQFETAGLAKYIRPGMGHLLFALFAEDNLTMRELTGRTGLAPSSVTETVQKMERSGLLSRTRDTVDKRSVRVSLTPLARSLEPRLRAVETKARKVLEDGLTAAEARQLRASLSCVVQNLHEHLKPDNPS